MSLTYLTVPLQTDVCSGLKLLQYLILIKLGVYGPTVGRPISQCLGMFETLLHQIATLFISQCLLASSLTALPRYWEMGRRDQGLEVSELQLRQEPKVNERTGGLQVATRTGATERQPPPIQRLKS